LDQLIKELSVFKQGQYVDIRNNQGSCPTSSSLYILLLLHLDMRSRLTDIATTINKDDKSYLYKLIAVNLMHYEGHKLYVDIDKRIKCRTSKCKYGLTFGTLCDIDTKHHSAACSKLTTDGIAQYIADYIKNHNLVVNDDTDDNNIDDDSTSESPPNQTWYFIFFYITIITKIIFRIKEVLHLFTQLNEEDPMISSKQLITGYI